MTDTDEIKIHNFARVNDRLFRGSQPKDGQYYLLKAIGVQTVVDLCDSPKQYARRATESCGMTYINLPLSSSEYPGAEYPAKFFNVVNDRSLGRCFIHCAGGRHRTGAMVAVFRMEFAGWPLKKALKELESFDFGWLKWRWINHRALKRFVEDYALGMAKEDAR